VLGPDAAIADRCVLDAQRRALAEFVLATCATAGRLESFALAWSMTDRSQREALAASVAEEVDTLLQAFGASDDLAESMATHGAAQRRMSERGEDTPSRRVKAIALKLAEERLAGAVTRQRDAFAALDAAARAAAPPELRAAVDAEAHAARIEQAREAARVAAEHDAAEQARRQRVARDRSEFTQKIREVTG